LPHVGKIVVFLVIVIGENGLCLRECCAGQKRNPDPVVNDAARDGDPLIVIERVKLL